MLSTWRPTEHFDRMRAEGRKRPPPSMGSPTFVWHIGVWRKSSNVSSDERTTTDEYIDGYIDRNKSFLDELSELIASLQSKGEIAAHKSSESAATNGIEAANPPIFTRPIVIEGAKNQFEQPPVPGQPRHFESFPPHSHTFVMWWRDGAAALGDHKPLDPDKDKDIMDLALRVVVQTQIYRDYATITIYIDGAKRYSGKQIHTISEGSLGLRRAKFADHLDYLRESSHSEITSGRVDFPSDQALKDQIRADTKMKAAIKNLYDDIWDEFQKDFDFQLAEKGKQAFHNGVVFLNHRGLLMSVRGLDSPADAKRTATLKELASVNGITKTRPEHAKNEKPWVPSSRGASATVGPVNKFDGEINEPEVVLKSMWPALATMEPRAGALDWVGCGILENRAIFVSTLGAQPIEELTSVTTKAGGTQVAVPAKFLLLSKGEPHRKQIGRFVDRILSLETMRIFALKNLGSIENAYYYLGSVTSHLDDILKHWSEARDALEKKEGDWKQAAIRKHTQTLKDGTPDEEERRKQREGYYNQLSDLNAAIETRLIHIGAELERMGPRGSGHLAHNIARSQFLINRFTAMVETLEIENLNGWINYKQFAQRGLGPTFELVSATGSRLVAAQERLKALTDVVQVSALIVQSAATRQNTSQLELIAARFDRMNRIFIWASRITFIAVPTAIVLGMIGATRIWSGIERLLSMFFG